MSKKKNINIEKIKKEVFSSLNNKLLYFNDENNLKKNAFLDKFYMCEFIIKELMYHYFHCKNSFTPRKDIKLNMIVIKNSLSFFGYSFDDILLNIIFGASDKRGNKSCKKLRDSLVHNYSSNDCYEVCNRYDDLISYMDEFINSVREEQ